MLHALVRNTEWGPLLDLLSPAFFDVIPARALFGELRGLSSRYVRHAALTEAYDQRSRLLERERLPFELVRALPRRSEDIQDGARGEDILALYFHQILGEGPVLLDLRRTAFARRDGHWLWKPEPAIGLWDDEFRAGCRALYEGFYLDDPARFSRGARALGLGQAEAELRAQFGDTHAVSFSLREFQRRFHAVFKRCKETKSQLHPNFLTLGLALATLYEHLEAIGAPLDVNAAFERVHDRSRTAPA